MTLVSSGIEDHGGQGHLVCKAAKAGPCPLAECGQQVPPRGAGLLTSSFSLGMQEAGEALQAAPGATLLLLDVLIPELWQARETPSL